MTFAEKPVVAGSTRHCGFFMSVFNNVVPVSRLKECLNYCPETGVITAKQERNGKPIGHQAGYNCPKTGYIYIRVNNTLLRAHRVAWAMVKGEWPIKQIDHINMNRSDNRWVNLREASNSDNMQNRGRPKTNISGFKGVSLHTHYNKWVARIQAKGVNKYLGVYWTKEDAYKAYITAAKKMHGEFFRASI